MIALLCPTRDRLNQFRRMCDSVDRTSKKASLYSGSNGDLKTNYSGRQFPLDCPTVFMWEQLAQAAEKDPNNKLFMLCSDDVIFTTPGWDDALIEHYEGLTNKIHVYAFQDSRDANGTPHPIVTREWMVAMGYFMPPLFMHWFVDTWTVEIAKANNCFTHLKDYLLVHDKPSDKGLPDETHKRIRRNGWFERDKFVNDRCQAFKWAETGRLNITLNIDNIGLRAHNESLN